MPYSAEQVADLKSKRALIPDKYRLLMQTYIYRKYRDRKAREFAAHGFARRLRTLTRCIYNVFEILPPDRSDFPSNEELTDAALNLQAFVFNVFGCLDNLAWIWVHEARVTQPNGAPVPNARVGLGPRNELVRNSFSKKMQDYLSTIDNWFATLEDYRHALAHRIPLYIPPHVVKESQAHAYAALEERMTEASMRGAFDEYDCIEGEQLKLGFFEPIMTHAADARGVRFHPQILVDFLTVEEVAKILIEDLDHLA